MNRMKNQKELRKLIKLSEQVQSHLKSVTSLSDEELKKKTEEFRNKIRNGRSLEQLLPEAFAVVCEAADRVLGMTPFPVQIQGAIALHRGYITEMKTGEGKTLVATMPAYLNALSGNGVHIVTVNDYLAKRDADEMGQIHTFLGLTVGVVLNSMNTQERKAAYACDITYVTNNELGFDYLRDHMALRQEDVTQRGLSYAIIDEVDSVLIDEARTPLIVSGAGGKSTKLYEVCNHVAKLLHPGTIVGEKDSRAVIRKESTETGDYIVDEKDKLVTLTEAGTRKIEDYFQIERLEDSKNLAIYHHMILALRAHALMMRDRDYIVSPEGEVLIVDEFTGRVMPGRRYSDGLHQAIEAKEGVIIQKESQTCATITFQNLFNKYQKKAGMTGTAMTEWREFKEIYHMKSVCIPTNLPVIRKDLRDVVMRTKKEKYDAIIHDIVLTQQTGQPVLVGTVNIEVSEYLSELLKERGIVHSVLNAKYHEKEAMIISQAGKSGSVTIATNMAGRGTDIKLDDAARKAGGLKVIGTERHESRRIDNQLRGRSGRQGDPGKSVFYLSLEDDLLRLFGTEKWIKVFQKIGVQGGEAINHPMLEKAIQNAQKQIEGNHFGMRKGVLDYDSVINEQRDIIYKERNRVLAGDDMRGDMMGMLETFVQQCFQAAYKTRAFQADVFQDAITQVIPDYICSDIPTKKRKDLLTTLFAEAKNHYEQLENLVNDKATMRDIERYYLLREIDQGWMNHLTNMDLLKQGIGMQAIAQKDPKVEYKMIGYELFEGMTQTIMTETLKDLFQLPTEISKSRIFTQNTEKKKPMEYQKQQRKKFDDA